MVEKRQEEIHDQALNPNGKIEEDTETTEGRPRDGGVSWDESGVGCQESHILHMIFELVSM